MYTVYFWTVTKKTNSTYHPIFTSSTVKYDCDLMDNAGILAPTLVLNGNNPTVYNYAYIPAFARYYYVQNWRYNLGLWNAELQVDPLASWADDIKKLNLYIARSSQVYDENIRDTAYPMLTGTFYSDSEDVNPFATSYGSGYFIAGIVNTDDYTLGAVSYYVFTSAEFRTFLHALMGDIEAYGSVQISFDLAKLVANPFQYIVSCRWMPVPPPAGGTAVSVVPLGWWNFGCSATRLPADCIVQGSSSLPVPKHPQADRGTWLNEDPYANYYLIFPPFGAFPLPAETMLLNNTITFEWSADYITGAAVLTIKSGGAIVTRVQGQLGAEIALAQMAPQLENMTTGLFNRAVSQMETGASSTGFIDTILSEIDTKLLNGAMESSKTQIETFAQNAVTFIANAYLSSVCPAQVTGNNGGVTGGLYPVRLCAWFRIIADESLNEKGRPLCQNISLYGVSGFIQAGESDVAIPCTKPELEAIKTYLISGMFLE